MTAAAAVDGSTDTGPGLKTFNRRASARTLDHLFGWAIKGSLPFRRVTYAKLTTFLLVFICKRRLDVIERPFAYIFFPAI